MGILSQERIERIRSKYPEKPKHLKRRQQKKEQKKLTSQCRYHLCRTMYPDRPADIARHEKWNGLDYCSSKCYLADRNKE